MESERFITGQKMLQQVDGKGGEAVVESLKDIAPDFARYLLEFPFGDIYARPGLDLRSREIATVAALTAMGNAAPQLKVHIGAALHVGLTQDEIVEVIMQMAVYAGFLPHSMVCSPRKRCLPLTEAKTTGQRIVCWPELTMVSHLPHACL